METVFKHQLARTAALQASSLAASELENSTSQLGTLDEFDDSDDNVVEIEQLQNLGIPSSDISKLKAAGIHTVAGAVMVSKKVRCCFLSISVS